MAQKPSIPKGTRDFSPEEMMRRTYIFDSIKSVFRLFGYAPLETPSMENLSTLLGKYGDEGDKLLFKILNSGDYGAKLSEDELRQASKISEKGLRYDLTVPFARYVVQHQNEIVFPFKRYQIQPVWRADRPQKGRYREFYQCDADIIGNNSLINEVELIQLIDHVFGKLNIRVAIKLNNRKVLAGIADVIGEPDKIIDITVAIDKIDKIGLDGVIAELKSKGISDESIEKLLPILKAQGNNDEKMQILAETLKENAIGEKGVEELRFILDTFKKINLNSTLDLDLTLARGLNYYTGAILEVKALDVAIGSITGGGRYDNLTGVFGMEGVSGVGISFGADRIYDVMNQLELYPKESIHTTKVMFVNFGDREALHSLKIIGELRKAGISAELFPSSDKMKKQMSYANSHSIPFVAIIGEQEMTDNTIALKNMITGEQKTVTAEELKEILA